MHNLRASQHQKCFRSRALGRALLASVLITVLVGSNPAEAREHRLGRFVSRRLQQGVNATNATDSTVATSPPPSPASPTALNATAAPINATAAGNVTANGTLASNSTSPPPPHAETAKEKIEAKWDILESKRTPAERGVAITIGVLMLVSILTCLACCVFRRGGQWRIPGLQWFKKKFGSKDRYSRYSSNDDGF